MSTSSDSNTTVIGILSSTVPQLRDVVAAAEPTLTALDEATGDGDFGSNLDEGLQRAMDRVDSGEPGWDAVVGVFLDEVGGTSGPLFGLLFQSVALAAASSDDYASALASGLENGLAAIQRVGEAQVGDRTMVDALAPAVAALAERPDDLAAMVHAAVDGARATAEVTARRGRSSYIGNKALGHPDPGAIGLALVLTVLAAPALPDGAEVTDSERERLLAD